MKIITDENVLSVPCTDCIFTEDGYKEIKEIIHKMHLVVEQNIKKCVGLAANQVGHHRKIILVRRIKEANFDVLINPKIIVKTGGIIRRPESCLSRPGKVPIIIRRHKKVVVGYQDDKGAPYTIIYKGIQARVLQHEMDHLRGILI